MVECTLCTRRHARVKKHLNLFDPCLSLFNWPYLSIWYRKCKKEEGNNEKRERKSDNTSKRKRIESNEKRTNKKSVTSTRQEEGSYQKRKRERVQQVSQSEVKSMNFLLSIDTKQIDRVTHFVPKTVSYSKDLNKIHLQFSVNFMGKSIFIAFPVNLSVFESVEGKKNGGKKKTMRRRKSILSNLQEENGGRQWRERKKKREQVKKYSFEKKWKEEREI